MLGVPQYVPPSLSALRGKWRHLVVDVRSGLVESGAAVYVGRSMRFGPQGFGNFAARTAAGLRGARRVADYEACVLAYAAWLGAPEQERLRHRVRSRLRGRLLACHCRGSAVSPTAMHGGSESLLPMTVSMPMTVRLDAGGGWPWEGGALCGSGGSAVPETYAQGRRSPPSPRAKRS